MNSLESNSTNWGFPDELVSWLCDRDEAFEKLYFGLRQLVNDTENPYRLNLLCYAIRDLIEKIPSKILTGAQRISPNYQVEINEIQDILSAVNQHSLSGQAGVSDTKDADFIIPNTVVPSLKRLLEKRKYQIETKTSRLLVRSLGFTNHPPERLMDRIDSLVQWSQSATHGAEATESFEQELFERLQQLESILSGLANHFFEAKKKVDELLEIEGDPSSAELARIDDLLITPEIESLFFSNLTNSAWLQPLEKKGYFNAPPSSVVVADGTQAQYWGQSEYLKKVASDLPDDVCRIIRNLDTDNWIIIRDVVDAALRMPANYACKTVDWISKFANTSMGTGFIDVGKLVRYLLEAGKSRAGFSLFKSVFRRPLDQDDFQLDWWQLAIKQEVLPSILASDPKRATKILINWFRCAYKEAQNTDSYRRDDYSFIWRQCIEEDTDEYRRDLVGQLLDFLRTAFESALTTDDCNIRDTLELIDCRQYQIFRRLRIHLVRVIGEKDLELVQEHVMDRDSLIDIHIKHEYSKLVDDRFGILSESQKSQWLDWIKEGPVAILPDYVAGLTGDKKQAAIEIWKRDRFAWVRRHLAGEDLIYYEALTKEYGASALTDRSFHIQVGWEGEESPFEVEAIRDKSLAEVIHLILDWGQRKEKLQARGNTDGVMRVFREFITENVRDVVSDIDILQQSHPVFARCFFQVATELAKKNEIPFVREFLGCARSVLGRGVDTVAKPIGLDDPLVDGDWAWSRTAVCEYLEALCKAKGDDALPLCPISERGEIWSTILAYGLPPNVSRVSRARDEGDPRLVSWDLYAINSPAGDLMKTIYAYIDWYADIKHGGLGKVGELPAGFNSMPEVRTQLEALLGNEDDGFFTRGPFGLRVGQLCAVDRMWLETHTNTIFGLENRGVDLPLAGWAAWSVFLSSHRPHRVFGEIFIEQFSKTVDHGRDVEINDHEVGRTYAFAAEHLMILYANGSFGEGPEDAIDFQDGLIRRLVLETHPSMRMHAVTFLGRAIDTNPKGIDEKIIARLKALWALYWSSVGKDDAKSNPSCGLFGYWYTSGVFDNDWSLRNLIEFLEMAPLAEPDDDIVETTRDLASTHPMEAIEVMKYLVQGDDQGWRIGRWRELAFEVFDRAKKANPDSLREAKRVIDLLGKKGFLNFGDLLSDS